jgi:hypothetical protein
LPTCTASSTPVNTNLMILKAYRVVEIAKKLENRFSQEF